MRVGKPTPIQAEWLAKLGLPGLQNYELPDTEVGEQLKMVRLQHGTKRTGHQVEAEDVLQARAEARVAYRHYGRRKMEEQAPHPYVLELTRRITWGIAVIVALLIILLVFAIIPGHAQTTKANAGVPARSNTFFWNGTAYVPVEAAAPLPITCNNCSGSGLSVVDNTAFTASTSPFIPIGGWYSSTPTNCTDGRQCTALLTATRHLWTTCDNCSSSSFTDLAAFTPAVTPVGFAGCFFQTTPTNNPLTNLTGGAPQCNATRELYTTFRTTPTVNVGTFANTLGVTQSTSPWVVSVPTWAGGTLGAMANYGTSPGAVLVPGVNAFITNIPAVTQSGGPWTVDHTKTAGQTLGAIANYGTSPGAVLVEGVNAFITNIPHFIADSGSTTAVTGTVAVTQSTSPWVGSCTAANCTTEIADGAANKFTSNSNTYTAKFGLDANILGLDGALMSATNALFTQITDGAAAHGVMANFGVSPGGVKSLNVNASIFSGTTALGAPNTFGTTAPTGNALGVNAAQFIGTTAQINDGTAGAAGVGGHFADNGVAAATNRLPTLDCIYQTDYLNGTAATQGRNGAQSCGLDGLLWTSWLPAMRPASYHASASIAGSSTTVISVLPGNASDTVLVTGVGFTCTQTTAGTLTVTVNKTSAAATGGTSAGMTEVPDDSGYAAANTAALTYTGTGPTVGTLVGQIDAQKIGCGAPATAGPNDFYYKSFKQKPIVLRGTAQTLEIGAGGAITGGNITVTWDWIETKTITP